MNTEKVNQHLIGKTYRDIIDRLEITEDGGDCCGWSSCEVITDLPANVNVEELVLSDCVQITYDQSSYDNDRNVINFMFSTLDGGTVILGYELSAGSGSGWSYGAYVSMKLDGEELASASW